MIVLRLLPMVFFAGVALAAQPGAGPQKDKLVAEVLDLSGTKRQIEQLPAGLLAFAQIAPGAATDPEFLKAFTTAVGKTFVVARMNQICADHVKAAASLDQLHACLKILRSPIALRFTEWEVAASGPEAVAEMQQFMQNLGVSPPDPARVGMVRRLDDVVQGSSLLLDIQVAQFRAMTQVAIAGLPADKRPSAETLERDARAFRSKVETPIRGQILASYLFAYRQATDAELASYVELLESPDGLALTRVLAAGMKAAFSATMEELGREMVRAGVAARASATPSPAPSPSPSPSPSPAH